MKLTQTEELLRLQCQYYRLVNGILSMTIVIAIASAILKLTQIILG